MVEAGVGNAQSNIEHLVIENQNISENGIEEPMTSNDNAKVFIGAPTTKNQSFDSVPPLLQKSKRHQAKRLAMILKLGY